MSSKIEKLKGELYSNDKVVVYEATKQFRSLLAIGEKINDSVLIIISL